jgi:hypothetical protein
MGNQSTFVARLYQSYYPDGIYTAGDAQALRDDIAYAKRVGFDLLRVHIKIDDPLLLYYADTIGLLLICDMRTSAKAATRPPDGAAMKK